jgi:hypothetical protein
LQFELSAWFDRIDVKWVLSRFLAQGRRCRCPNISVKLGEERQLISSDRDEERSKRRIHKIIPWFKNPVQGVVQGADSDHLVFAPHKEAERIELFFDLFL